MVNDNQGVSFQSSSVFCRRPDHIKRSTKSLLANLVSNIWAQRAVKTTPKFSLLPGRWVWGRGICVCGGG